MNIVYRNRLILFLVVVMVFCSSTLGIVDLGSIEVKAEDTKYQRFAQTDVKTKWTKDGKTHSGWGNQKMGNSGCTIGQVGCLMTTYSVLMAYANPSLRDVNKFNPAILCQNCKFGRGGGYISGVSKYDNTFSESKQACGGNATKAKKKIKELIKEGKYVFLYAGKPVASGSGHFSPVIGWDDSKDEPVVMNVGGGGKGMGYIDSWERWASCLRGVYYCTSKLNPSYETYNGKASNSSEIEKNVKAGEKIMDEWDMDGMPENFDFGIGCEDIDIPDSDSLSQEEKVAMEIIKDDIETGKKANFNIVFTIISFLGLFVILYGVFLGVAYMFDRNNNIFDISLLGIITLGRYKAWDEDYGVAPGYNTREKKMYCDTGIIVKRIVVMEIIGFLLVSGIVMDIIYNLIVKISNSFGLF